VELRLFGLASHTAPHLPQVNFSGITIPKN